MSNTAVKVGGGIVAIVVAVGGMVAKNADNVFRAGARNARHLDGGVQHLDDIGRMGGRLDGGADLRRLGPQGDGAVPRLGAEAGQAVDDADSVIGDVVQEGVGAAADAAGIISSDDDS